MITVERNFEPREEFLWQTRRNFEKKLPNIFVGKYFKILFQNFDILIEFETF